MIIIIINVLLFLSFGKLLLITAIFRVQGTLYTGNNSDLYLWSSDLANSSTIEYITLKMKLCTF
ncbi:unnamed protein product, partial [Schistosoma bovis]